MEWGMELIQYVTKHIDSKEKQTLKKYVKNISDTFSTISSGVPDNVGTILKLSAINSMKIGELNKYCTDSMLFLCGIDYYESQGLINKSVLDEIINKSKKYLGRITGAGGTEIDGFLNWNYIQKDIDIFWVTEFNFYFKNLFLTACELPADKRTRSLKVFVMKNWDKYKQMIKERKEAAEEDAKWDAL
jgi:hypothetical protein